MEKEFDFSELEKLKADLDLMDEEEYEKEVDFFEDNDDEMEIEEKERKRFVRRIILGAVALVLVLLAGAAYFAYDYMQDHIYVGGRFYSLNASSLDLRGKYISLQEYEDLCAQYPDYKVLWDVPVGGNYYSTSTSKITVKRLTATDVAAMAYLPKLRQVNANDCTDYAQLVKISKLYPRVRVSYRVIIGGKEWPPTVVSLDVSREAIDDLKKNLGYLEELVQVNFTDSFPDEADIQELEQLYPQIVFYGINADGIAVQRSGNPSSVVIDNKVYSLHDTTLDLTGASLASDDKLAEKIGMFEDLKVVCLQNTDLSGFAFDELCSIYPQIKFLKTLSFGNVELNASAKTIDISGQKMSSVSEIEEMLPLFPEVTKVIMADCGIGDQEMDALNHRYDNIEFVWAVKLGRMNVRTDERVFAIGNNTGVTNADLQALRYCTNMICVDLFNLRGCTDIEWISSMPNLKYLVISNTNVKDLTPLTGMRKLVYLEMFNCMVKDYTPLTSCTALEDLNIGWTYGEPEPIAEMKWLKNVYWGDSSNKDKCSGRGPSVLSMALPDANLVFNLSNAWAEGWRRLNNYYQMRDLMGLSYQDQGLRVSKEILEKIAINNASVATTAKKK